MASTWKNAVYITICLSVIYLSLTLSFLGGYSKPLDPCNAPPNSTFYQKCNATEPEPDLTEQFPSLVPCTSSNWSGGSAFFTLMALGFGYFAHPRGCSFFQRAGRMWRLNAAWVALEALVIIVRVIEGLGSFYPLHSICYAVLAVRAANSLRQDEINRLIEEKFDGAYPDEDEDTEAQQLLGSHKPNSILEPTGAVRPVGQSPAVSLSSDSSSNDAIPTSATLAAEEAQGEKSEEVNYLQQQQQKIGQEQAEPTPTTQEAHQPTPTEVTAPPPWPSSAAPRYRVTASDIIREHNRAGTIKELEDAIFAEHLRTVAAYESGPTFRMFIFIPMLFQVAKLLTSKSSGFHPYLCWIYFVAFLIEELLLIAVARRPLTRKERLEANRLSRDWRRLAAPEHYDAKPTKSTMAPLACGVIIGCCTLVYSLFAIPNVALDLSRKDVAHKLRLFDNPNQSFLVAFLCVPKLLALIVGIVVYAVTVAVPWPLMAAQGLLMLLWASVGGERRFGPLAQKMSWGTFLTAWPVWIAGTAALLQLLSYAGAYQNPLLNYVCKGTYAPPYYDWLG